MAEPNCIAFAEEVADAEQLGSSSTSSKALNRDSHPSATSDGDESTSKTVARDQLVIYELGSGWPIDETSAGEHRTSCHYPGSDVPMRKKTRNGNHLTLTAWKPTETEPGKVLSLRKSKISA